MGYRRIVLCSLACRTVGWVSGRSLSIYHLSQKFLNVESIVRPTLRFDVLLEAKSNASRRLVLPVRQ